MDKRLRHPLIKIILSIILGSAALTYWITHDHHVISRRSVVARSRPAGPVLEKNTLVYCPICGESIPKKDDQ